MQTLQSKASEWSGVSQADAFAIDETNLFQKLGLQIFINLSTNFYTRVYDDEEEWFRSIFANSKKEDAIQNQYEFFVQRMGGPPFYSQRRGHPALIARHRPFPVTHQAAERWLHHMQQALESTPDIDADSKVRMLNFFRHTAFFLVAGDELKVKTNNLHVSMGPATSCRVKFFIARSVVRNNNIQLFIEPFDVKGILPQSLLFNKTYIGED